jgi:hypothetical protein
MVGETDEVEIDIDALDNQTLRELEKYVTSCLNPAASRKPPRPSAASAAAAALTPARPAGAGLGGGGGAGAGEDSSGSESDSEMDSDRWDFPASGGRGGVD